MCCSFSSSCCCLVPKSCPTLCNPMECSRPGSSVLHCLPQFAQIYVHWVRWCCLTISSSAAPFSSCSQSFLASEAFPMSWLFASSRQIIGASTSASVLKMNIQGLLTLGLTGLIPLLSQGLSRVFSCTTVQKHQLFSTQLSLWSMSHIHTWLLEKT